MSKSLADNPFITEAKDKNGDSWYHQIILEKKEEEIERLNKEIESWIKLINYNEIEDIPQYIEDLEVDNKSLKKENKEIDKENKRLNDIINELEHHLYQEWLEWKDSDCESIYSRAGEDKAIYDYLQELKGSESNECKRNV